MHQVYIIVIFVEVGMWYWPLVAVVFVVSCFSHSFCRRTCAFCCCCVQVVLSPSCHGSILFFTSLFHLLFLKDPP